MDATDLKEKVIKGAIFKEFLWVNQNLVTTNEYTVWDKIAKQNPLHAVAVSDEVVEKRKTLPIIKFLLSHLPGGNLLDLGCGYGRIAKYLLPRRQVLTYFGLDSAIVMLKIFNDYYNSLPEASRGRLILIKSPIEDVPLHDRVVDNVVSVAVFLHNPKHVTQAAVKEVGRILKPGGTFIVVRSLPNKRTLGGFQGTLYLKFLKVRGEGDKNGPLRYYSKEEVEHLFSDFKEVKIIYSGFSLIPKGILFLPKFLNNIWKRFVANPLNNFFERLITRNREKYPFCRHFDVILRK